MTCSFEIQPRREGHFWCDSGDMPWRRLGGKVGPFFNWLQNFTRLELHDPNGSFYPFLDPTSFWTIRNETKGHLLGPPSADFRTGNRSVYAEAARRRFSDSEKPARIASTRERLQFVRELPGIIFKYPGGRGRREPKYDFSKVLRERG